MSFTGLRVSKIGSVFTGSPNFLQNFFLGVFLDVKYLPCTAEYYLLGAVSRTGVMSDEEWDEMLEARRDVNGRLKAERLLKRVAFGDEPSFVPSYSPRLPSAEHSVLVVLRLRLGPRSCGDDSPPAVTEMKVVRTIFPVELPCLDETGDIRKLAPVMSGFWDVSMSYLVIALTTRAFSISLTRTGIEEAVQDDEWSWARLPPHYGRMMLRADGIYREVMQGKEFAFKRFIRPVGSDPATRARAQEVLLDPEFDRRPEDTMHGETFSLTR